MTDAHLDRFRTLHGPRTADQPPLLILPNAWDALSARTFEAAGAEAIATSSAALAWAHGYADGEQLPLDVLLSAVSEITRRSGVPTSVDFERGYAEQPERVADAIGRVRQAGAVGVNLEDGAEDPQLLAAKIRAIRARFGARIFINARTCVVLRGKVTGEAAVHEVLERARLFEAAGADSLFVPLLADPGAIAAVVRGTKLPLNVIWLPKLPPPAALAELGVRRLSAGTRLGSLAYQTATNAVRAWLQQADDTALKQGPSLDYREINALWSA